MIIMGTLIDEVDIDSLWEKTIKDLKKEIPTYFDEVTVRDAIGNLLATSEDGVVDNPQPETLSHRSLLEPLHQHPLEFPPPAHKRKCSAYGIAPAATGIPAHHKENPYSKAFPTPRSQPPRSKKNTLPLSLPACK